MKLPNWHPCLVFYFAFILLYFLSPLSFLISALVSYIIYLVLGGWRFQRIFFLTISRDLHGLMCLLLVQFNTYWLVWTKETFADMFQRTVRKRGNDRPAIYFGDQIWTFGHLDAYSNKVANYLLKCGFKRGDILLLLMNSSPTYVGVWIGAAKIGVATGLLNSHLRKDSLLHSIQCLNARGIVVGSSLSDIYCEAIQDATLNYKMTWYVDEEAGTPSSAYSDYTDSTGSWNIALTEVPFSPPPVLPRINNPREHLIYIYTSGTTGFPKPAIITKLRYVLMTSGIRYSFGIKKWDTIYNPLPLYHTAGGICGLGQLLLHGTPLVLRSKFSASNYWSDCARYGCTVSQYIGELCRYLLAQPPRACDTKHKVRLCFGNGLRPQVWKLFQERFKVPYIGEFYGATESNASITNIDNKCGAVGFISLIMKSAYPIYLIKMNEDMQEPIRDPKTGLCILCNYFEPGQLIGRISSRNPIRMFDGYVNKAESDKKVIRNVFKKGDAWFASGDMMYHDDLGYLFFTDRLGDTFRWHGENVSTTEVEKHLHEAISPLQGAVYGVPVPNTEGKAGMAAIALGNNNFSDEEVQNLLRKINSQFAEQLPTYARPLFIRICDELCMTSTFKVRKNELVKLGFDPTINSDPLYFLDQNTRQYVHLDKLLYENICKGIVRL